MSITVINVTVRSFSLDHLTVSWEIEDTTEDLSQFRFYVQRSQSPEGPWENASPPLTDKYEYRDRRVDLVDKWRIFFYRILVKNLPGDYPDHISCIAFLGAAPDLIALEMMRLHELQLKVQTGRPVLIYKKRTFGPYCPDCHDEIRDKDVDANCQTCLSSSYVGGYQSPIPVYANIGADTKTVRLTRFNEMQPNESVLDISGYPILHVGDVVIEQENRRWRVQDVRHRMKKRFIFRQLARIQEIPKLEVEYKLQVEDSLFEVPEDYLIRKYERNQRGGEWF